MKPTEFYAILERDLSVQNPTSPEKLLLLAEYCGAREGSRVLDVGSGKGFLLSTWAKRFGISGVGLELNPTFLAAAKERAREDGVSERLRFVEGPALHFEPEPEGYDIVLCIGASFALGGYEEALDWMRRAVRPGGCIAIGEPFLHEGLTAEERRELEEREGISQNLPGLVASLEARGLSLTGMIAASTDDWDRYESAHWRAAHAWGEEHPEHPERAWLLARVSEGQERYLRLERRALGWAIFVARLTGLLPSP